VLDCINPEWWTNKDEAEYEAAKMASRDELEVYLLTTADKCDILAKHTTETT